MLLTFYACLLWLSCSGLWTIQAKEPNADESIVSNHRILAPSNTDFALDLFNYLVASAPGKNVLISPVSISMALAMLSLGARGHTRAQLFQSLGFNLTQIPEAEIHQGFRNVHRLLRESDDSLEMGNTVFLNQSLELLESFSADAKRYYELDALATDFQDWAGASRQINEYIKNKTQGEITDFFLELDSPDTLILVNYIFFRGMWAQPFDQGSTREQNFYVNETTLVRVPMMMFQWNEIKYFKDQQLPCELVQLDYVGNSTAFFILPHPGETGVIVAALSRDTIQRWSDSMTISEMDLYIPKFSMSEAYDFRGLLKNISLADLLTHQENFSGITQETQLKLSKVVHKAMLQLDENSVQAAAPTGVTRKAESEPLTMHFNRTFIIMIFDKYTWSSLFLVKVVNPT